MRRSGCQEGSGFPQNRRPPRLAATRERSGAHPSPTAQLRAPLRVGLTTIHMPLPPSSHPGYVFSRTGRRRTHDPPHAARRRTLGQVQRPRRETRTEPDRREDAAAMIRGRPHSSAPLADLARSHHCTGSVRVSRRGVYLPRCASSAALRWIMSTRRPSGKHA